MVNITQLQTGCPAYVEGIDTSYGYIPSLGAGIAYCTLFGLSLILHTVQFTWKRQWWGSVFSVGCLAPTFFTAGIYVLLGRYIQLFGSKSSFLTPQLYLWIFCTCDVISLVLQAIGGGMASVQANKIDGDTKPGTHIMVAGIVFQLFSVTIFVVCAVDFFNRIIRNRLLQTVTGSVMPLFSAMVFSIVCIYIRSIYRTIELVQGWDGYLITHERYFVALDGAMMVLAVGIFNVLHPGWLLPSGKAGSIEMEPISVDGSDKDQGPPTHW
ncbi:RTA-like protein [Penicillium italicum]|uniref:RTA-like protein n=1 Tax=Penicillium italicum TaxID=40296 RepID=A0A0A2K7Z3_PENIT|nr:RTA-like protein [Penicillium italicum]